MQQYTGNEAFPSDTEPTVMAEVDYQQQAPSRNYHSTGWRRLAMVGIAGLAAAEVLSACSSSSSSSDSGETSSGSGQQPVATATQIVSSPATDSTGAYSFDRVWGPDGCIDNVVSDADGTVATQPTDLCRAADPNAILPGVTTYSLYKRGTDPIRNAIEFRGTDADATVYWEYPGSRDTYRQPVIGDTQIYVVLADGTDGFQDVTQYESQHPSGNGFLADVQDGIATIALLAAVSAVEQTTYTNSSSAATSNAQALYQQRQSSLSEQTTATQDAETQARNQENLDREYVEMGKINGQQTGVLPQGCDLEGQVSCDG